MGDGSPSPGSGSVPRRPIRVLLAAVALCGLAPLVVALAGWLSGRWHAARVPFFSRGGLEPVLVRGTQWGSEDAFRDVVTEFTFRREGNKEGWRPEGSAQGVKVEGGALAFRTASGGTRIRRLLDMDASSLTHIGLVMAVSSGRSARLGWEYQTEGGRLAPGGSVSFSVKAGPYRWYDVKVTGNRRWRGRIGALWLQPTDRKAQVMIAGIRLMHEYRPLAEAGFEFADTASIAIGDESRHCMPALVPSRLRLEVGLPPKARLRVAYGIVPQAWRMPGDGVTFRIVAVSSRGPEELLRHYVDPKHRREDRCWFERVLDLARYAGREVTLEFETLGGEGPAESADTRYDWAVWAWPQVLAGPGPRGPNVVLVLLDSLRADHVGCYGYPRGTTANMDALAARGVRFANAESQVSWTGPSLCSLLTSLPPHLAAPRNALLEPPSGAADLAGTLESAGYLTGVVSSHQMIAPKMGFARGVTSFVSTPTSAEVLGQKTVAWLRAHRQDRFFLYVHCFAPHAPYAPPEPFRGLFLQGRQTRDEALVAGQPPRPDEKTGMFRRLNEEDLAYLTGLYDGHVAFGDACVGRIRQCLQDLGLARDTALIVTADHGEEFMEHGGFDHGRTLYEEVLHVPLVMEAPGRTARRKVVPEVVRLLDVAPTIMDLVGLPMPKSMQGRSLLPALERPLPAEPSVAELGLGPRQEGRWQVPAQLRVAVRMGDAKVVRGPDGHWEYYALSDDPRESHNLVTMGQTVPPEMRALLEEWRRSILSSAGAAALRPLSPEAVEPLRALGYMR